MRTHPGTTVLRSHRPAPTPAPGLSPSVATSSGPPASALVPRRRRRRSLGIAVTAGLVPAVLVAAGGLWWFVAGSDAPAPATLDKAIAGIAGSSGSTTTGGGATADGTWTIDRTITSAQGTASFAGFRVGEILAGVGAGTAVGRTSIVAGTVAVQGSTVRSATITADLTAITSGDARLDHAVQGALATSRFPTATFC